MTVRNKDIDKIKGIGILFVVLGHYGTYMQYESWSQWIWSFHMPLFFLAGGYLAAGCGDGKISKYIIRQIKKLLIPYTCFFVISFILFYIVSPFLKDKSVLIEKEDWLALGRAFLLGGGYLDVTRINNFSLWFLQLYFLTAVVFRLLLKLRERSRKGFAILFVCLVISVLSFQRAVPGRPAFHINALPAGLLFMYLGFWSKDFLQYIENKPNILIDCAKWNCLLMGVVVAYFFPGNIAHIGTLFYIVGACGTVLGFYLVVRDWNSRSLQYLGRNSLYVLGLHSPVSALFRNYVEGRLLIKWDGPLVNFLLVGGVILGCCILITLWNQTKSCCRGLWRKKRYEKAG